MFTRTKYAKKENQTALASIILIMENGLLLNKMGKSTAIDPTKANGKNGTAGICPFQRRIYQLHHQRNGDDKADMVGSDSKRETVESTCYV